MIPSCLSAGIALTSLLIFLNTPAISGDFDLSADQMKKLSRGEVVILNQPTQAAKGDQMQVVAAIKVDHPVKAVANVLNDTESAPDYINDLQAAKVLERKDGYQLVEQKLKIAILPLLTYVIKHENVSPNRIEFARVSGDLDDVRGFWEFQPANEGKATLLVYSLEISPGIPVPGFLMKSSMKKTLPNALRGVRNQTNLLASQNR